MAAFRERRLQFEADISALVSSEKQQDRIALADKREAYAEEALPTAMALWRAVLCAQRDARCGLQNSQGEPDADLEARERRCLDLDRLALELREEVLLAEAVATGGSYNAVWGGESRWAAKLIEIAEGECSHAREIARQLI